MMDNLKDKYIEKLEENRNLIIENHVLKSQLMKLTQQFEDVSQKLEKLIKYESNLNNLNDLENEITVKKELLENLETKENIFSQSFKKEIISLIENFSQENKVLNGVSKEISNSINSFHNEIILFKSLNKISKDETLDKTKDVNCSNYKKEDIFLYCKTGIFDGVVCSVKNGINPNIKDTHDYTPLLYASENGYTEIVKYLIQNKAEIDLKHKDGWTPLMLASQNGHVDIVEYLLSKGAKKHIKNSNGNKAIDMVCWLGNSQNEAVIKTLLLKD